MRPLAISIIIAMLFCGASVLAEICLPSGDGYNRTYRPQGTAPNYHPITDPRCVPNQRDTNASNTLLCHQCHPHRYEAWMRIYWGS